MLDVICYMFSMRGLLISFDGVDSSGKETQARKLAERLRYQGHTVHTFTTPDYSTPSGQELKARLQGKMGNWHETLWEEKLRYFANNRAEHRDEVAAALERGEIVVYDRYVPSSLAFMMVEACEPQQVDLMRKRVYRAVEHEEYEVNQMPHEDLSLFLDVPPRVSAELLERRKEKLRDGDEYTDHVHVQERLYNEYDLLMRSDTTRFARIPCVSGTELLSIATVEELVWETLVDRFPIVLGHV